MGGGEKHSWSRKMREGREMEFLGQLVWRHPPWELYWKRQAGPGSRALESCPEGLQGILREAHSREGADLLPASLSHGVGRTLFIFCPPPQNRPCTNMGILHL